MKRSLAITVGALALAVLLSTAHAEVIQRGGLRVSFDGRLTPKSLPRQGTAPVRVEVATEIAAKKGKTPPRLRTLTLSINRYGRIDPNLVPKCTLRDIQPATTENALAACGGSLIGRGTFRAKVLLSRQAPFPSAGPLYAFNGVVDGKPAILAHVYGAKPVPTSFTLVFEVRRSKGTYGTVLRASLPEVTGDSGYITGLSLNLGKTVRSGGKSRSYLSASCPAPKGLGSAVFPFAKASLDFGKKRIDSTLVRTCKVRG
jgi:hypothetical protein